ncbi:MAG: hypothetical protein KAS48_00150 [Gammaproteobacteria bacterium]|nr:hypothetical protein [Gammaproteobacteria bacterium]
MLIPTDKELKEALDEAERLREQDDPGHLARVLLYLHRRNGFLEKVFQAAERYMQFGQEEQEHAVLLLAIEDARKQKLHDSELEDRETGL